MRSDLMKMLRGQWLTFAGRIAWMLGVAVCCIMLGMLLGSCAALSTRPTGIPGCPNRTAWSDSAQRCIAREGR